jgi:transcriptional regulator with GAF, ATPase, and Fis domain
MASESLLAQTMVELADTLVDDFDVVELLTRLADRCVEVLGFAAAGLMLAAADGELRVVASSSDAMRVLELFELQAEEGPCPDCFRSGVPIVDVKLSDNAERWPRFASEAITAGFSTVHALPMRLRGTTIGALNLFQTNDGSVDVSDLAAARAFADIATIGILQHRAMHEAQMLNEQLLHALNSRIAIEQAKGMISERMGFDMEQSFMLLRNHARNHNLQLAVLAQDVIGGRVAPSSLDPLR